MNNVISHAELNGELSAYAYDDELKNAYIKKSNKGHRLCLEPNPDAVQTSSIGLGVGLPQVGEQTSISDGVGGIALGGRNPEVLIARELLYRACEVSLNVNANYAQTRDIYREFLAAVREIAKYQVNAGSSAVAATSNAAATVSSQMAPAADPNPIPASDAPVEPGF